MNKVIRQSLPVLLTVCTLALPFARVSAQHRLGTVLAPHIYTMTEGDPVAFENLATGVTYPFYIKHAPGFERLLLKADRGKWDGKYMDLYSFESRARRDEFFPMGEGPMPVREHLEQAWSKEVDAKMFAGFKFGAEDYPGDYSLIGRIDPMPEYELLGLHFFKVKPGHEADFEKFVRGTWNPTVQQQPIPRLIYKADRGSRKDQYLQVYVFRRAAQREEFWPEPGLASEAATRAFSPFQNLFDQLSTFLTLESARSDEYGDFVLIK